MKRTRSGWRERLAHADTYEWAWEKVRHFYFTGDVWYDEIALADFESSLGTHIESVRESLLDGFYEMRPLTLAAQPKGALDSPDARQTFTVAFRDQLAWSAIIIAIGPQLDMRMPPWSYGGRLYRSIFRQRPDGPWQEGPYRHTRRFTYRPFSQGWNLYRRSTYLTVRRIGLPKTMWERDLIEGDRRALDAIQQGSGERKLPYLNEDYWQRLRRRPQVYWGSIDFEKFYPNLELARITQACRTVFEDDDADGLEKLLKSLLTFPVDTEAWDGSAPPELTVGITPDGLLSGLPTGLIASAFLANTAMLAVDRRVSALTQEHEVAHFRYVDDHIVIGPTFQAVRRWIETYRDILASHELGVQINWKKSKPDELANFFDPEADGTVSQARQASKLDPEFPTPLLTTTLAQMSMLAEADFELMDRDDQDGTLRTLEHLLLTPIEAAEVRRDTRMAFAASLLARLAPQRRPESAELLDAIEHRAKLDRQRARLTSSASGREGHAEEARVLKKVLDEARRDERDATERMKVESRKLGRRILAQLCKALRDHPAKIRVWKRAVQLCASMEGTDQAILRQTLKVVKDATSAKQTYPYLISQLCRWYAREIIRCLRTLSDQRTSPAHRDSARSFLETLYPSRIVDYLLDGEGPSFHYRDRAQKALQLALGAVEQWNSRRDPQGRVNLRRSAGRVKRLPVDWSSPVLGGAVDTWSATAISTWADEIWSQPLDHEPSPFWRAVAECLPPEDLTDHSWLEPYPNYVPAQLLETVSDLGLEPSEAWLIDATEAPNSAEPPGDPKQEETQVEGSEKRSLHSWWLQGALTAHKRPNDPRFSEWTALWLVECAARMVMEAPPTPPGTGGFFQPHPRNILVPTAWEKIPPSWGEWTDAVTNEKPIALPPIDCVLDPRFQSGPDRRRRKHPQDPVASLGSLLLFLLKGARPWPAGWHSSSPTRRWWATRALVRSIQCSSWSSAVLTSSIFPRARESRVLKGLFAVDPRPHDDTVGDPPPITTSNEFIKAVCVSREVLEVHQLHLRANIPRQLTPVTLKQLAGATWSELRQEVEGELV